MLRRLDEWTWAHLALLVLQMGSLLWLGRLTSFEHGFPLDDAWIHQVVGRTFADTGVLGYSSDRFGSAATSLTWAFIVSINHAWFHVEPALFSFFINAALLLTTGQLWLAMLRRDGAPLGVALGCAAFGTTASNFVWFAFSGMESILLVFLSTLVVWLWTEPGRRPALRALGSGVALGLLFLTRPEAAALLGVLVAVLPWTGRRWRDLALAAAPCLLAVLAYAAAMAKATGDARPSTLEGRRIMWFQDVPNASAVELIERMLIAWGERLSEHALALSSSRVVFWLMLGLSLGGAAVALQRRWLRFGSLVLWAAGHLVIYMLLLPTPGHGGRYQPLTPAMFLGLAWIGAYVIAKASSARWPTAAGMALVGGAALAMTVPTARSLSAWSQAHRDAVEHIWNTEVAMGRLVAELPDEATVASFDIGGIGYFAERDLIDLGALVDASLAVALRDSNAWPLLEARDVDYVVLPEGYAHGFPGPWNFFWRLGLQKAPASRLVGMEQLASPLPVWKRGVEASLHGAPLQVLYRIGPSP